jgi:hypothetical protein
LAARCFAGDSAGVGDCACEIQMPADATTAMRAEIFVNIDRSVDNSQPGRQCISEDAIKSVGQRESA